MQFPMWFLSVRAMRVHAFPAELAPYDESQDERKNMDNKFDELTKSLAQSVTRRAALKKLGVGLAGMALACFGVASKAEPVRCANYGQACAANSDCCSGLCFGAVCRCTSSRDC